MTRATVAVLLTCAMAACAQESVPLGEVVEAESLKSVGAEAEEKYAAGASGGAYVYLPEKQMEAGQAPLSYLEVPLEELRGQVTLRIRAYALSGSTDSLLVHWGSGARSLGLKYDPPQWGWYEVGIYGYAPGPVMVMVGAREPARIDALEVVRTEIMASPHQPSPVRPEPNGSRPLEVNPPTFRWLNQGPDRAYRVQVSRMEDFSDVIVDEQVMTTFLRPLAPLPTGRLWWRLRTDAWEEGVWTAAESFEVPEDTVSWPLPPWEESFARVPQTHPRLWLEPGELERMREWAEGAEGAAALQYWRDRLTKELGKQLPLEQEKRRDDDLTAEEKVIRRVGFKGEASRTAGAMGDMALFYALTGDEGCAKELARRALLIADLDPTGYASHAVSDFGNGTLVEGLAFAYDFLQDDLTGEELARIRDALAARLAIMAQAYRPNLEQRVHNAHAWQHVFLQFLAGALALYGEEPRAADWFRWGVQATVALYPWFGGAEGGSAEMASYFAGTNLRSSMELRDLIHAATGLDLLSKPWYRNNIYYAIYSHPPNHMRSQFGDHPGGPWSPGPGGQFMVMRYRAALFDDPFAAAYVSAHTGPLVGRLRDSFKWLTPPMPAPASLGQLPAARAFADIGTAFMHSAIDRPDENIFFEFKSSPYGSYGHSHNDQNCFNLSAFNEPLLVDTGYYHSFGDAHHAGWTMTTRAHNGILVDGTGQPNGDLTAYGKLIAFEQGDEYMYCAGEASWAYHEVKLDRFTRHVLCLKPDLFFVYDQLEAAEPHTYQYLLHAERQMRVDEAAQTVEAVGEKGACRVTLVTPGGLSFSQDHVFDPPARRWREDRKFEMPDQWHLTAATAQPAASQRFLAIIEVVRQGEGFAGHAEPLSGEGWLGARLQRDGAEVLVGFADALTELEGGRPAAEMKLGPVQARAYALVAELRGGQTKRLVTIGGEQAAAAP